MDQETFEKKLNQELQIMNPEQTAQFAWRCAVRALPFLAIEGNFNFWGPSKRHIHLYSIFNALDTSKIILSSKGARYAARYAARDAARAATAARDARYAARDARYARYATAAADAARDAAARYARAAARYARAARDTDNLRVILVEDLAIVQGKHNSSSPTDFLSIYGKIWALFQQALKNEDCSYWGNLYQQIFENQLVVDEDELQRRLQVPTEIQAQGAAAVGHYLEELETQGAEQLNEARVIILGEKGAGKTCLARRLLDPNAPMTEEDESTAGVDTLFWTLEKSNINARIWDFAGHTVTHAVHQFFLSERCLYVIVYDGRSESRNRLNYWLNHMKNYGGDSKAIILVNRRDQHAVEIPINTLKEQYAIQSHHIFSIRDDRKQLQKFRKHIAQAIEDNLSWNQQLIPKSYYRVKAELEQRFIKDDDQPGQEHISKTEFEAIAQKHQVANSDQLLADLHALGVSLWYHQMAHYDKLVLNPEWISEGVYQIINWASGKKKYGLALKDLLNVFEHSSQRYSKDCHPFLFDLMKHFELAYETQTRGALVIPHLLPEDQPAPLPDFPVGESLELRYIAEQPLPPDTISRFIVRHHKAIKREAKKAQVWRSGVVLKKRPQTLAMVRERDRTISVMVKGKEKTNFLSELRDTLNDIFGSYKSKQPELQYRVQHFGEISNTSMTDNTFFLPERKIINHVRDNVPYYEDNSRQEGSLQETARVYNIQNATFNQITGDHAMVGNGNQTHIEDHSTHFNFYDCNLALQGDLNELGESLKKVGLAEEAKSLESAAEALEQVENADQTTLKKKNTHKRLKRIVDELADEKSQLHKTVKGMKQGIGIAQDIAEGYNSIAQWMGLPQVPKPFLKKK